MSHPSDHTQPAALDASAFEELADSLANPPAVAAIYRKFIENATLFIGELREQDAAARAETLHTLKGSAAMLGADSLSRLAEQLQAEGLGVQVEAATARLAEELERFRLQVASRLQALGVSLEQSTSK